MFYLSNPKKIKFRKSTKRSKKAIPHEIWVCKFNKNRKIGYDCKASFKSEFPENSTKVVVSKSEQNHDHQATKELSSLTDSVKKIIEDGVMTKLTPYQIQQKIEVFFKKENLLKQKNIFRK